MGYGVIFGVVGEPGSGAGHRIARLKAGRSWPGLDDHSRRAVACREPAFGDSFDLPGGEFQPFAQGQLEGTPDQLRLLQSLTDQAAAAISVPLEIKEA